MAQDAFGNWIPNNPPAPAPFNPPYYQGAPSTISYVGPPVVNPPELQGIVVDVNGRVWVFYDNTWN